MSDKVRIKPFDFAVVDQDLEWRQWREELDVYIRLKSKNSSQEKKLLQLKYVGGRDLVHLLETLKPVDGEIIPLNIPPRAIQETPVYDNAIKRLNSHFAMKNNSTLNLAMFEKIMQKSDESFNQFATRLRVHSQRCEFKGTEDEDRHLRMQVHRGALSEKVRQKVITSLLTFDELVKYANVQELVDQQKIKVEQSSQQGDSSVSFVERNDWNKSNRSYSEIQRRSIPYERQQATSSRRCGNCGLAHPTGDISCRARDQECYKCRKKGHFARNCRNKENQQANKQFAQGGRDKNSLKREFDGSYKRDRNEQRRVNAVDDNDWQLEIPVPPRDEIKHEV